MRKMKSSNFIIALSNIKVDLKPKGKVVYKWCCYYPETLVYQGMSLDVNLKYGGGDTSESSLVFLHSKNEGANGKPLLSNLQPKLLMTFSFKEMNTK